LIERRHVLGDDRLGGERTAPPSVEFGIELDVLLLEAREVFGNLRFGDLGSSSPFGAFALDGRPRFLQHFGAPSADLRLFIRERFVRFQPMFRFERTTLPILVVIFDRREIRFSVN
jgi:hypothetical protein